MIDQQPIYIHSMKGMYTLPQSIPYISPYSPHINDLYSPHIDDLSCNSITIQQAQDVGSAYIVSVPSGAKIYIDNVEQVGITTPATINNIPSIPQEHTYKLVKSGYMNTEGSLFITAGQTYNITVTMCKVESNIIWPFMIGAAIVGILLLSRKEKKELYQQSKR